MTRETLIELIRSRKARLDELNVKRLALFGSVARGDERSSSDIDLLVEFDGPARFDNYVHLLELLEELTGRKIDLVTKSAVKPRMWPYINRDAIEIT